jgi:hypothetical protein
MNTNESPAPERIMQFAWGYAPPLVIEAAVRHGVFVGLLANTTLHVATVDNRGRASYHGIE